MSNDACPLPQPPREDELSPIEQMLAAKRIAIVGLSDDPGRASFNIASYLLGHGYDVIPINPNCISVMGRKCHPSLKEAPAPIDVFNVFRRPEFCADIV